MDLKSPPSSSGQFLVPMGRARRKSVSSSTPADSVPGPSSASTSAAAAANANASTNTRANASQTFPGSTQGEGVVIYKKPIITPSQIAPTQATQLIEGLDEEDSSEEVRPPSVSMHGHGATFHQELVLRSEIDTYVFGTASDCDIIISHKHWRDIEAVQVPDSIPWFKVQLQGNRARDEIIFVTIENVCDQVVSLNGKPLVRHAKTRLNWGDVITGGAPSIELFRYSYRSGISNERIDKKIIKGELSSYRPNGLELGKGAYARVYTVVDEQTSVGNKKVYACKEVDHLEKEYSRAVFENLLHEITVLKRLNHKNIVKFHDVCQENFKTYIITEFIEGWTLLKDYGSRNNFYSEVEARRYFKQVCEAINYLHSHNIVHRDIKSENIMIEGETKVVKLIDFGLARNSNTQPIMTTLCGTYHYMAPETAYGDEKNGYGRAVDIWSLGALLFRMLSAVYPSEANTPAADAVANLEGLLKEQRKRKDERRRAAEEMPSDIAESSTFGESNHSARKVDRDEELQHSPQGKIPTYTENWGKCLDRQIPRTPEVHDLLKQMLSLDATKRPTISMVLQHDWMRITPELFDQFERENPRNSVNDSSSFTSVSAESTESTSNVWGRLTIVPGSIADAPRTIELVKETTMFGARVENDFKAGLVDVHLGNSRYLSTRQCLITREMDGVAMIQNGSVNGMWVNHMLIRQGLAVQIFSGDMLSLMAPDLDSTKVYDDSVPYTHYLKYTLEIVGASEPTQDEIMRRKLEVRPVDWGPNRSEVPQPQQQQQQGDPWAVLIPLSDKTKEEQLFKAVIVMGRDLNCDVIIRDDYISREQCRLYWKAEEDEAYLFVRGAQPTWVNDKSVRHRIQLRDGDKILLAKTRKPKNGESSETPEIGYTIRFTAEDERPQKRLRAMSIDP